MKVNNININNDNISIGDGLFRVELYNSNPDLNKIIKGISQATDGKTPAVIEYCGVKLKGLFTHIGLYTTLGGDRTKQTYGIDILFDDNSVKIIN